MRGSDEHCRMRRLIQHAGPEQRRLSLSVRFDRRRPGVGIAELAEFPHEMVLVIRQRFVKRD